MKSLLLSVLLTCSMLITSIGPGAMEYPDFYMEAATVSFEKPQDEKREEIVPKENIEDDTKEEEVIIDIGDEEEVIDMEPEIPKEVDFRVALEELGFLKKEYSDEIDARNAILRFQSKFNLTVDGFFGIQSSTALYKVLAEENYVYPDKVEKPPTENHWVVINKSKRILTLYKGKEVVKKYPIAQGKYANLTPEGKFTIVNKAVNPYWGGAGIYKPIKGGSPENPLGYRWMGISHGGGGKYGIHGNNNPLSIGTNASLGCVRMINSDVEELYEIIPISTIVWIGTEDKLLEWGINQESYLDQAGQLELAIAQ